MKKTFPLDLSGKARPRVVEAVKHDARRYVQRERRKPLPEGFSRWTFHCRVGSDPGSASACALIDLGRAIDDVANAGGPQVYLDILAVPGHTERPGQPPAEPPA